MEALGTNFVAFCGKKNTSNYHCELCNYTCSKKYNWDKHILTARHLKEADGTNLEIKSGKKWQKVAKCSCEKCNKEFKTSSGLWKHKQKCKEITSSNNKKYNAGDNDDSCDTDDEVENIITDKKLILMLINQNKELIELVKNGMNN